MRNLSLLSAVALFSLLACGDKDDGTDDTAGDSGDTEDIPDGVSPQLSNGDAYCYLHNTGEEFYQWAFSVDYTDPQGSTDVPRTGHDVDFLREGNVVKSATGVLICDNDQGWCIASFKEADYDIPCASAEDWTVRFTIYDYEGNTGTLEVQAYED